MRNTIGLAAGLAVLLSAVIPASGQYFVQQGNVLDANNRLGSGGLNYGGPQPYRPNQTNRIVTGNVTAGAAFRGFSPIRDPNSFFLGSNPGRGTVGGGILPGLGGDIGSLPSDRLTNYRRDSVGVNDLRRLSASPTMAALPYYSRTSTVADTGQIIRGLNEPGTSQLQSSYVPLRRDLYTQPTNPLDAARNSLVGSPLSVDSRLVRADMIPTSGTVNNRLLRSPLFGGVREVPISKVAQQADNGMVPATGVKPTALQAQRTEEARRTAAGTEERKPSPLDLLLGLQPGERSNQPSETGAGVAGQGAAGQGRLSRQIGAKENEGQTGGLARPVEVANQGQAPLRRKHIEVGEAPLRTFTGTPDERMKAQMADAEKLLRDQRYYDAARRYEMAHAIDLQNPLPMFGRAMSLLAAGDYVSSANDLFMAIQSARPAGAVQIDLQKFIPDLKTLDTRRAFMEKQLQVYEDFRLRFLLGWAEYMSGMPELGLADMRKGAKAAPENMDALRQFVEMLAQRPTSQPAGAAR